MSALPPTRERERPGPNTRREAQEALDIARRVAGEAATLLRGAAGRIGPIDTKANPRDLVTEWDRRSEDLIRERLQALTPDIALLGEERGGWSPAGAEATEDGGDEAGEARDRWLVDPIDGTVNFAHGVPMFAVSIALERRGRPIVGVVHAPALGWEHYAHLGGGAFVNGERVRVSGVAALPQAMLATGFPYDRATNPDNNFDRWAHFQRRAGACRRMGSASLDLCMVARGWFDGYWENQLKPWDIAAGMVLVEEAGGRISSFTGGPVRPSTGEIVASNGMIHDAMLAELATLPGATPPPSPE
ncbi:inositol monophosphatase family protein [Haliangium sp.]|uniref:inositol monophosphatase family protein n=1 Tax=Haliangium sp. TaxID=2663208 RepID=UPI003D127EFD